jgi:hypothetical protein
MKTMTFLSCFLFFIALKTTAQTSEHRPNPNAAHLWQVAMYTYVAGRETPVSKTVYSLLAQAISKDIVCEGTHFKSETAYIETWTNERDHGSPVWKLDAKGITTITTGEATKAFCGNEKDIFAAADVEKFPMMLDTYPAFTI